jgi:hypothetical protein
MKFSPEYLKKTIQVFQKYSQEPLTLADAQEIADNLVGLGVLMFELEKEHDKSAA